MPCWAWALSLPIQSSSVDRKAALPALCESKSPNPKPCIPEAVDFFPPQNKPKKPPLRQRRANIQMKRQAELVNPGPVHDITRCTGAGLGHLGAAGENTTVPNLAEGFAETA